MQNEQLQAHIKELVEKLNQNKRQLDVILDLSSSLVEAGDLEQAEELLTKSLGLFPNDADLRYNLGNVYFLAAKYDRSLNIFDELIDQKYGFEAYLMKAKTLSQQDQNSLAIVFALSAAEMAPKDSGANELLADLLLANGDFDAAITYYQKANEIDPQAKYLFNIALCLMNLNKPYQSYLDKAKELDADYFYEHEKKLAQLQKFLTENGGKNDRN